MISVKEKNPISTGPASGGGTGPDPSAPPAFDAVPDTAITVGRPGAGHRRELPASGPAPARRPPGTMVRCPDATWLAPIGPTFGPFAEANGLDLALHVLDEVVHHAAEVGLLRDLYAARPLLAR